jgi:putative membrane protein
MLRPVGKFGLLRVLLSLLARLRLELLMALVLALITKPISPTLAAQLSPSLSLGFLGIAVSIFLGVRSNQAYGRWWEARTLWGQLRNESRNWRGQLEALISPEPNAKQAQQRLIHQQVLLVWRVNQELRPTWPLPAPLQRGLKDLSESVHPSGAELSSNALLVEQAKGIHTLTSQGHINHLGQLSMLGVLDRITSAIGGLERIRAQPAPSSYVAFSRLAAWSFGYMVFLNLEASDATTPLGGAVGLAVMVAFIAADRLATFLDDPFTDISTGLPLNRICTTISGNLLGNAHPLARPIEPDSACQWH